jgi:acetone carboxylase gamma subunit
VPEGSLLVDPVMVGSGYGDPLDRDPQAVLRDLFDHAVSRKFAQKIYGVALDATGQAVDEAKTKDLRERIRADRLEKAVPVNPDRKARKIAANAWRPILSIHECLAIVEDAGSYSIGCRKCNQDFGAADHNYKDACVYRSIDKDELTELPPPGGRRSMGRYIEYYCPGCATLLDVETSVPEVEGEAIEPVWDIQISSDSIQKAAAKARRKMSVAAE